MSVSYAGDRLQEIAQSWLVAVVTGSALAVGGIAALNSLPQFFMPLGGVVADQVDRRKMVVSAQLAGAVISSVLAFLVWQGWVAIWHIYIWAVVSGTIWLFSRPAFKVILTESVPHSEVRYAVSLNSITETTIMLLISALGSVLLYSVGLAIGFILNALSYLTAAVSLWRLTDLSQSASANESRLSPQRVFRDLADGLTYLVHQPELFVPLLFTFSIVVTVSPTFGLLAAIIHTQGGSIISLGLLGATGSLGSLLGALYAGSRSEGSNPVRMYMLAGLAAAFCLGVFALTPIGWLTPLPLAVIGLVLFAQAVWNTARVRLKAEPAYQARLQSITTMTFVTGGALGQLWGGAVVDRFGIHALLWGSLFLSIVSILLWFLNRRYR